jgi:hypothetical protein
MVAFYFIRYILYNCRIIFGDSINFDSFDLEDIINDAEKAIHKVKSLVE